MQFQVSPSKTSQLLKLGSVLVIFIAVSVKSAIADVQPRLSGCLALPGQNFDSCFKLRTKISAFPCLSIQDLYYAKLFNIPEALAGVLFPFMCSRPN